MLSMISDSQLNQLEKQRQKESDWVLQKLNLIPILQKYGQVKIAGAKALGLMIAKDIDISVIVKKVKYADWLELVSKLMLTPYMRNISAIDYYNYDEQNNYDPKNGQKYSLYIGINNIKGPENDKYNTWNCQIHLIDPAKFDESKITKVLDKLSTEKRLIILRLKHWANQVNQKLMLITNGNFKIYSPLIYEAVLEKNINTIPDFLSYYKKIMPKRFYKVFEMMS